MTEANKIKTLLIDILAGQGADTRSLAVNAINAIKFDQPIVAPIVINQSIAILTGTLQKRIARTVKQLDKMDMQKALQEFPNTKIPVNFKMAIDNYKRHLINQSLDISDGNKTRAAKLLGMNRTTLTEQMKSLDRELK